MKVITIEGEQNSGKTTLVRNVLRRLVNDGAEVLCYETYGHLRDDFHAVVIWRGRKITLCSIGDLITYIRKGIEKARITWSDILLNTRTLSVEEEKYKQSLPPECDLRSISVTPPNEKNVEAFIKQNQVALETIMAMLSE
ncbi:MAG: hypothetical protein K2J68_04805 [Treponemataceae bacterium]|nr:hypothetical protein [Treponemataceae bacterium]